MDNNVLQKIWHTFHSPDNTYKVQFPNIPQKIPEAIYVSKDKSGNLFASQKFTPPDDITQNQSSKEILQTSIKMLILKKNIVLTETTYSLYKNDYVAVDFTGKVTTNDRIFKGKMILEGKTLYYLYSVLIDESPTTLHNYEKFIYSFKLID